MQASRQLNMVYVTWETSWNRNFWPKIIVINSESLVIIGRLIAASIRGALKRHPLIRGGSELPVDSTE